MLILGIESSCDDTAAAVVRDGKDILSNVISSQADFHRRYGGIVPEIASRKHLENIVPVINEALRRAGTGLDAVQGIAVTQGPGLVGSLLVGINAAKAIAYARGLPLTGINHLEGHLLAPHLQFAVPFPNVTLVVSGGHTNLYLVKAPGAYEQLGRTRDDAAGEAFDKVAKLLGLGYPGGAVIDEISQSGRPDAIRFPRPMIRDSSCDFSFSGLKTAVRNYVHAIPPSGLTDAAVCDIVAGFQAAVTDILVEKTVRAALDSRVRAIAVAGGVASNSALRIKMRERSESEGLEVFIPPPVLCTDNAAMIAAAGELRIQTGAPFPFTMNARSRWQL